MRYPLSYREAGGWVVIITGALGLIDAIVGYATPGNGIDYTPGALLVVGSTGLIVVASLVIWAARWSALVLREILAWLVLLDIICTAFAAYLLETEILLVMMVIAAAGWIAAKVAPDAPTTSPAGKAVRA